MKWKSGHACMRAFQPNQQKTISQTNQRREMRGFLMRKTCFPACPSLTFFLSFQSSLVSMFSLFSSFYRCVLFFLFFCVVFFMSHNQPTATKQTLTQSPIPLSSTLFFCLSALFLLLVLLWCSRLLIFPKVTPWLDMERSTLLIW